MHRDLRATKNRHFVERFRRRVPRVVGVIDKRPAGERDPRAREGVEGLLVDRGTDGMAAWWKMPSAPGKVSRRRSRSVMLPSDEGHPGMIQEVLDVLPSPGGEVVDDDDVVVLC